MATANSRNSPWISAPALPKRFTWALNYILSIILGVQSEKFAMLFLSACIWIVPIYLYYDSWRLGRRQPLVTWLRESRWGRDTFQFLWRAYLSTRAGEGRTTPPEIGSAGLNSKRIWRENLKVGKR
jgi:hypothetical protein